MSPAAKVRKLQTRLRAKESAPDIATIRRFASPALRTRVTRARATALLMAGLMDKRPDYQDEEGVGANDVTLSADIVEALHQAAYDIATDLFWITKLDDAVLDTPAPDDDTETAIEWTAERKGGAA